MKLCNNFEVSNNELKSFSFSEIAALNHKFSSVTLYRNKTVKYSARMHAIIACQMEFQLYPMDIQICPIYIESCKFNNGTRLANRICHIPAFLLFFSINHSSL